MRKNPPVEQLKFQIAIKDLPALKKIIKTFDVGAKNCEGTMKGIREGANYTPPELSQLSFEKLTQFQLGKHDAIAKDVALTMEYLLIATQLCAHFAVKSAFATQYIRQRMESIEKSVNKIAKETNVDISSIKREVDGVKNILQSPIFDDVVKMFKEGKTEAEKSKRRGEETIDNLTRSH
jgi:hypothetical protein